MKKTLVILIAALLLASGVFLFTSCGNSHKDKQLWTCPMHPDYISDKPGDCPICGMKLVKVEKAQSPELKAQVDANSGVQSMPGMDMGERNKTANTDIKTDRINVKIDPDKQQLINVRLDTVSMRELGAVVSASGAVAYDPELYYAQEQLISASRTMKKAKISGSDDDLKDAKSNLESAQTRMKIMGLGQAQIDAIAVKESPDTSLLVNENNSKVWIYAQVYQDDLKNVKNGASVEITSASTGSVRYPGRVVSIDPSLNPETRSARVRISAENGDFGLKPEMYVDVKIRSPRGKFLSIPEEAVLDTGKRQIVFVAKEDGYFEPRYVVLGEKVEDYYTVKAGVSENEKIVVNGNFMIDSESQLKAAMGNMTGHKH